ncbi:helix-turn-helix transcriptional regulator [Halomonas lysinitropha]|uniref:Response regulator FixJ n=1 Tax=Halomonas lysinitropha TaxID=2607506 RepID=A0A5K1HYA4_9GAMM|nr:LuxR C-terminal-related transcriptional regulator [Halomonas lysinitropha]VVZ94176.1 response regulator FixJ [Halomonas lysinitropha]
MATTFPRKAPSDWEALLATLAECVTHLGTERFDDQLIALLRQGVGIEQCILFVYSRRDTMESLLVDNPRYPKVAGRLADLYAGGLFRQDPNYPRLCDLLEANTEQADAELMPMPTEAMSPAYRGHLFGFPDLADKVSVVIPAGATLYYLNLYRDLGRGPFGAADLAGLEALMPLLASLIRRHYRQVHPAALPASHEEAEALKPLSQRERQLCLSLLRGHTLKTAAAELDIALSTAETYRKRAYAKLGVRSKARLVALCRKG